MARERVTATAGGPGDGRVPYTLRAPHWHGGVEHPAGATVLLYPDLVARVRAAEAAAGLGDGGGEVVPAVPGGEVSGG